MSKGVWLWVGGAILVLVFIILAFGNYSSTGNPIATLDGNDTTPPSLQIYSSFVDSYNVAKIYGWAYDAESVVNRVQVAGPVEYTGLIRSSYICNINNCSFYLNFSYNSIYDNQGDTYRVYAINAYGFSTSKDVILKFSGESNQTTCTPSTCVILGKQCGTYANGTCSGTLNCGTCLSGQTCVNGQCVNNPINQTNCTDSDGGINFLVKGTTSNSTFSASDTCTPAGIQVEYYCDSSNVQTWGMKLCTDFGSNYRCVDGACIKSVTGMDYSVELISATDTSATIKVSKPGGIFEVKELTEGSSKMINGLSTYLLSAEANQIYGYELAKTRYNLVLGHGGTNPDVITLKLLNGVPSQHRFELISATDTSATIKVTDMNTGIYGIQEFVEGSSYLINGVTLTLNNADETSSTILADFNVEPFTFKIENVQPFCTDSDGGINYYVLGTVTTQSGNYTDYCNTTATGWLNEYYCSGNSSVVSNYNCPYSCNSGVCLPQPKPKPCNLGFFKCLLKSLKILPGSESNMN